MRREVLTDLRSEWRTPRPSGRRTNAPNKNGAGITGMAMMVNKFGMLPSKTKLVVESSPAKASRRTRVELLALMRWGLESSEINQGRNDQQAFRPNHPNWIGASNRL
jgi:hypothetical protein